jgi:acetyltransferase-like isoleucine patch superfamily enzyme
MKNFVKKKILNRLPYQKAESVRRILYRLVNLFDIHYKVKGQGNRILHRDGLLRHTTFEINGNNNRIEIHKEAILNGMLIKMTGSGHRLVIGKGAYLLGSRLCFEDNHCSISIGPSAVVYRGVHMGASEEGTAIEIGDHCCVSAQADIRTTDSHSVINLRTEKRVNPPGSVIIGKHVFIGERATILKGVTIGDGSMIGLAAVVTKDIPPYCVAAGFPARIIRENATWAWDKIQDYEDGL